MTDGSAEFEAAIARVREGDRAAARCGALAQQIGQETAALDDLKAAIEKSEHRVADLEGHSLAHVVAALRRREGEELDAAQARVRAAQLELATRQRALDKLTAEHSAAQARGAELDDDRRVLAAAQGRREAAISQAGGPQAETLRALSARSSQLTHSLNECDELIGAAQVAEQVLSDCLEKLHSAGGWATYDTFFHGGIIAASMEHQRVDEAARTIGDAQVALQRLAADIHALHDPSALLPEISPSLKAANIWFDNLFSDWMVRSRISASEQSVETTYGNVRKLVLELSRRRAAIAAELQQTGADRNDLLSGLPST
jgi:hypothetical protein